MTTCKDCKHWQEYYPRSKERVCNRPGLHIGSDWNLSSGDATVVDCEEGFDMITGPDFGCTLAEPNAEAAARQELIDKINDLHQRAVRSTPKEAELLFAEARKLHKQLWSKV